VTRRESESAGSFLREHVRDDLHGQDYLETRRRFVEAALALPKSPQRPWLRWAFAVAAFALSIALGATAFYSTRAPVTFAVGPGRSPGITHELIESINGDELPLYFSEGSVVNVAPASRVRVAKTTAHGAGILVESGTVSANVVHTSTTDWTFLAGAYTVRVTGTAFVLSWEAPGVLDIRMQSGTVMVRGPGAPDGVTVRDHARFPSAAPVVPTSPRAYAEEAIEPREGNVSSAAQDERANAPSAETLPAAPAVPGPASSSLRSAVAADSWNGLVARGEYARVVELAERNGIEATLGTANIDDLGALADAARFRGNTSLAERVLVQIRTRFPSSTRAHAAAFLIGRLADDAGNPATAVGWYERYLNETPNGSLAAEAMGRRLLSMRHLGDPENTKRAAQEYLNRFPSGPYAAMAHEIVGP
jgi:TolA-binding protein